MVFEKILKQLTPSQSIKPTVTAFLHSLPTKKGVSYMIGGSVAKDTYLAGDFDCDVFVRFDPILYATADLSDLLQSLLTKANISFIRVHGSRDYFQFTHNSIAYEFVPVLAITDPSLAQNTTDMSALHVQWVLDRLTPALRNDVRLLRAFTKAQRVYGAESYIGGFSGHVLDILVIYYKGFIPFLKKALTFEHQQIIDPMNFYKGKNPLMLLNESKITSPIIVIDPLLPSRNAASALTQKTWNLFLRKCRSFLRTSSKSAKESFFTKKPLTLSNWTTKKGFVVECSFTPLVGKRDVIGAKMLGAFEHIQRRLTQLDFVVVDSFFDWDKRSDSRCLFLLKAKTLSSKRIIRGPPISLTTACTAFTQAHGVVKIKQKQLFAYEPRVYRNAKDAVAVLLQEPLVTQRVAKSTLNGIFRI
jgi:tRNA nucleotidyltransferase (CCA-adding enzyme)